MRERRIINKNIANKLDTTMAKRKFKTKFAIIKY